MRCPECGLGDVERGSRTCGICGYKMGTGTLASFDPIEPIPRWIDYSLTAGLLAGAGAIVALAMGWL